jgi:DnaD/phage-associated family protein
MKTTEVQAKYSAAGNRILPNTFQQPNIFVDRLMYYLTPEENVVLTFAVRRILGFQDNISSRKDNISLSQFVDGITAKDGTPLSNGCGLGTTAVRAALATLEKYKILLPSTTKPDPRKGQEYWLQENELAINWDGLEERVAEKRAKQARRTQKARSAVGQQGAVGQQARGTVRQQLRVLSDNNTKPRETQGNQDLEEEDTSPKINLFSEFEHRIGPITPFISEALPDLEREHPPNWIVEAMKIAEAAGKRSLGFVVAVLKRWKVDGYGTEYPSRKGKTNAPNNPSSTPKAKRVYTADELEQARRVVARERERATAAAGT